MSSIDKRRKVVIIHRPRFLYYLITFAISVIGVTIVGTLSVVHVIH